MGGASQDMLMWEQIKDRVQADGLEKYLPFLLSDHVPMYFDYTGGKGGRVRIMFANNASLLGERGIVDNRDVFGRGVTLTDLKQWSDALVAPLTEGMIKLIRANMDVPPAKIQVEFQKI